MEIEKNEGAENHVQVASVLNDRLGADVCELISCLEWYVREDETNEGGHWEETNAPWISGKRRAQTILEKFGVNTRDDGCVRFTLNA